MRAYRVKWREGRPSIEAGEVIFSGKKRQIRRIKFPSEHKTLPFCKGFETINEAIEADIIDTAKLFSGVYLKHRKPKPWALARAIAKVVRLHRKLKAHHLV